jgi:uncharacterized protein YegJ (DUF2314 family)
MKAIVFILLALSISQVFGQVKMTGSGNYGSVSLVRDDSTFLALKDTAQAHLQTFIDNIRLHGTDTLNYHFGIKSDFIEGHTHEHMWSAVTSFSDGKFNGVFIDSAFVLKHIKTGNKVTIEVKAIEDWTIYNLVTGKTTGYFSEMYLNKKE